MKTIKIIALTLFIFTMNNVIAQSDQKVATTTTHTFNFEKDGVTVPYRVTVHKTTKSKVKLSKEDKDKVNQNRKAVADYVTKLIYIDNDTDDAYDRYIVLRYAKDSSDSFELKPTKRGFNVIVDKKYVEYIFGEGLYFVNNEDADFFFIDEFEVI